MNEQQKEAFEAWWGRPSRPRTALILDEQDKEAFRAIWNAALESAAGAPVERQAPEGFAIVPLEPSTAILAAMQKATDSCQTNMSNVYLAMIAAAPSAQGRSE